MSDSKCCGPPKPIRAKRQCHFDPNWPQQYPGIGRSSKGSLVGYRAKIWLHSY